MRYHIETNGAMSAIERVYIVFDERNELVAYCPDRMRAISIVEALHECQQRDALPRGWLIAAIIAIVLIACIDLFA